jgi:hypothetical protein
VVTTSIYCTKRVISSGDDQSLKAEQASYTLRSWRATAALILRCESDKATNDGTVMNKSTLKALITETKMTRVVVVKLC